MATQPKPAKGGADAHREPEQHSEEDEEGVPGVIPDTDPIDRDGGGGGGDSPTAPGSTGAVAGIPVRKVMLVGAALLAAYLIWKLAQRDDVVTIDDGDERGEPGDPTGERRPVERGRGLMTDGEGNPVIPQDQNDPLKADDVAGAWIFGDLGWGQGS